MKSIVLAGWKWDGNAISIIRTADALGFDKVIILGRQATRKKFISGKSLRWDGKYKPKVVFFDTPEEILAYLKGRGYNLVCMELDDRACSIQEFKWCRNPAIIVGHENTGVPKILREDADYFVMLPMRGDVRCLNVSCAASIAIYDYTFKNEP